MSESNATHEIESKHSRNGSQRTRSRSNSPHDRVREHPEKDYEIVDMQQQQPQQQSHPHVQATYGNDRADAPQRVEAGANKDSGVKVKSNQKGGAKKNEPCLTILDTSNRDPNHIAENVRVTFEDIIAEPDQTLYSFDQVWDVSKLVYVKTKLWVYRVITLLFGVVLAIIWGLVFALVSFAASWCCVPCMKCYRLVINCCKPYYVITIDCTLEPVITVISKLFYNIRVFNVAKNPED